MFERYTERARRSVSEALKVIEKLGGDAITPQHVLLGILQEYPEVFGESWAYRDDLVRVLETTLRSSKKPRYTYTMAGFRFWSWKRSLNVPLSPSLREACRYAEEEAGAGARIDVGHLLLGVLGSDDIAMGLLVERGVSAAAIRQRIAAGRN